MNVSEHGKIYSQESDFYIFDKKIFCRNSEINRIIDQAIQKNSFYVLAEVTRIQTDGSFCTFWINGSKIFRKFSSLKLDKNVSIVYHIGLKVEGVVPIYFHRIAEHSNIVSNNILHKKFYDFLITNHFDLSDPKDQFVVGRCMFNFLNGNKIGFEYFKKAANMGHLEAQYHLGLCYYRGIGVEQDYKEAFDWFKKSADAGCLKAQYNVFEHYFFGKGVNQNEGLALEYCKMAAKSGFRKAQLELGCYYISKDRNIGYHWFGQAANDLIKNNLLSLNAIKLSFKCSERPSDIFFMGFCLEKGYGVEKNEQLAFILYLIASEQEDIKANYRLGCCYEDGVGVEVDYKKAFEYYNKSVKGGCVKEGFLHPLYELANMYEQGFGVETNLNEALRLYTIAAEKQFSFAQHKLGVSYRDGRLGLEKNNSEAIYWFEKAAEQNFVVSIYCLAELYTSICQNENQKKKNKYLMKKIFQLYKKAADIGSTIGEVGLANCYIEGAGVLKNIEEAKKYADLAAKKGNAEAIFILGQFCLESDPQKAMNCFFKAAEKGYSPAMEQLSWIYKNGISRVVDMDIEVSKSWGAKALTCPPYSWIDSEQTDNITLVFDFKYEISKELKFWLNSVFFLSQKYHCSATELNVQEIDDYAKELKDLHEKIQNELDQKCQRIQEEYYKKVTLIEVLSEFSLPKTKVKIEKQEVATHVKRTLNTLKSKKAKAKAKAKARAKAKANAKKSTIQTTTNVSSTKKNCQTVKKPLESKNRIIKALEKLNKNKASYQVLPRVTKRWSSTNLEYLRNLTDVVNGQIVKRYESLSDEELLEQRALHFLPKIEEIQSIRELKDVFTFTVNNGAKVLAQINFGNGKPSKIGMISFGVDKNKNSEEKDVLYHRYMNLEESVDLKTLCNPIQQDSQVNEEGEDDWINVSNTTFDISAEGLKVSFKGEAHSLILFPVNYKAWYNLCGVATNSI